MPAKIRLLIIDPQNDFCDAPPNPAPAVPGISPHGTGTGALAVPGAYQDLSRLAGLVRRLGSKIDDIIVTLDSHRTIHIAHPVFWIDGNGRNPPPFTLISAADVEAGLWTPRNPAWRQKALDYVRKLADNGRYVLCIWPPHCLIGSAGHAVQPELFAALHRWESDEFAMVNYVTKGSNPFREHYSAVAAEVPDFDDPSTLLNGDLIDALRDSDLIPVAGEALSHCLLSTVTDIADNIGEEHIRKFVLLEDCTSPVPAIPGGPDFPAIGRAFIDAMKARGMKVSTSAEFLS